MTSRILHYLHQLSAITLLLCFATAGGSDPAKQFPKVWFSMGGWGQMPSPGHHSWEVLYLQPNGTWPPFMDHVTVVGILTQVLVKMSDAGLARWPRD
jgi:hypothetical protein